MCGIAGVCLPAGRSVDPERLRLAAERLAHRGPDDRGFLGWDGRAAPTSGRDPDVARGGRVALAHRRLAILDLTPLGWQPMSSPDGRFHLVFNGEIYNYRELRTELMRDGRRFVSTGDTEVLLAAWSAWGPQALARLVGMFAFGLLDLRERQLVLARDFFGIKPLYYHASPRGFAFASEIPALLDLTGEPPRAQARRLYDYLRFGLTDHSAETMFEGVRQLPAAHLLTLDIERSALGEPERYWDVDLDARSDLSPAAAAERLRAMFLDSVRLHLRSDVPVGTALSGGIDSSSIVMAMRQISGPKLDLHSVSFLPGDPEIDETPWVETVARASGARLHRTRPEPAELVQDLERLIAIQAEPFGSTSIYAQHRVFRLAHEAGIKVMLDGQGADELFAGYRTYLAVRLASLLRRGHLGQAARLARAARELPGVTASELFRAVGYHVLPQRLHGWARRLGGRPLEPAWLDAAWLERAGIVRASPVPRPQRKDALREMLYKTLTESSLPMLLRYEDRNSMAYSIESRVPFLTPTLAQFVLSLPEAYLVDRDGTSKAVLRRAMRGLVPDVILDRRDKIGFATPERRWLTELRAWVEQVLASDAARAVPALDLVRANEEWQGILAGRRRFDWHVWRWINTIRWAEKLNVACDG